jgi:hypothetical protein
MVLPLQSVQSRSSFDVHAYTSRSSFDSARLTRSSFESGSSRPSGSIRASSFLQVRALILRPGLRSLLVRPDAIPAVPVTEHDVQGISSVHALLHAGCYDRPLRQDMFK